MGIIDGVRGLPADHAHPAFVDERHFSGTGWVKVMTDEVVQPTLLLVK